MPPALMTASLYLCPIRELLSVMAQEMPMTVLLFLVFSVVLPEEQEHMSAADRISAEVKKIVFIPGGDLLGARTQDPNIKSVVLYQLS